ncbi:MAG TPA: DRTGG domain-containing protein [Syntrophorhabdaceae bacterium]|nr:DRTGG domain-containing protein [Syntrophorhabdaceae bacterium]
MKLKDIAKILDAQVLCCADSLDREVKACFACDLISEMLLYVNPQSLLITSLTNAHVIHTAQVMDASGVIFVGGKKPEEAVIKSGKLNNVPLLSTPHLIYECCGRLFTNGIRGDKKIPVD